ncbi:MAG TPA: hypothetical protein PL187_04485 [Caldilinea sp.]|nr:hypothetical protein [Caldilinea sp.]
MAQEGVQAVDTLNREEEIVYIDAGGYIRVYDPQTPNNLPPVVFRSPDAGWYDATVGDVNGDGDDEILAFAENGLLKIYDPVVTTTDIDPDNQFGGIYWEQLFELLLPGQPLLLDVGNLDSNPSTLEFVVVYREPDNQTRTRIQVFYQPVPSEGGRLWLPLTDVSVRELWSDMAVGDLDGDGQAEIVLVNEDRGILSIFRREANNVLARFWNEESSSRPWQDVAIGNVEATKPVEELVAVRRVGPPAASLVVRRYKALNQLEDIFSRSNLPAPRVTFLADVTAGGDQEIFLLRDVPSSDARPRLFSSNLGTDPAINFEARLDADNGYRFGASGDVDDDGKDEVAVIRDNAITIFTDPQSSSTLSTTLTTPTNRRTIVMGNLDRLGRDRLAATPTTLRFSVPSGAISAPLQVTLGNNTRARPIPFFIRLAPATGLLQVTPSGPSTPASLAVSVDARTLLPASMAGAAGAGMTVESDALPILPGAGVFTPTYGTNLVVISSNPLVANAPITIPVIVDVTAGIALRPSSISLILQSTPASPDCRSLLPATLAPIQVLGTISSTFTAAITAPGGSGSGVGDQNPATPEIEWPSQVNWLSATSPGDSVPTTVTFTLAPNATEPWPSPAKAELVLNGLVDSATPFAVERRLAIEIRCYSYLGYLPLIER